MKINPKIEFKFNIDDNDMPQLNVDTKFKSIIKKEYIIINTKRKRKILDASTKLF